MEQIFMLEIFVKKIILKVELPEKTPSELLLQEEERKRAEEAAAIAAAVLAAKMAKKKGKKPKKAKGKKGKKGKEPPQPSEEEIKYFQTCAMQMHCLPIFDFNITHDNFVEPPPPPPPSKGKKGKKGKPKKKAGKKGKKGKKGKGPLPRIVILPSEPLPQPPFYGVGESVTFISRPSTIKDIMLNTPILIRVWNRDLELNCIGMAKLNWHESFIKTLDQASELNPVVMDAAEYRNTNSQEIVTNTVEFLRPLHCEEDLKPSGEIEFFIKLSCLGNKMLSYFITVPEMDRLPGRKYLHDESKLRDLEVVRHWNRSSIDEIPPVAYLFAGPDIIREPTIKSLPEQAIDPYKDYVAPFTTDELLILSMGFPKGPCGGTNCPRRMEFRGSQHQFIHGEYVKGKYQHGKFVNKRDVHGPCGRLDCPLAKTVRSYLCDEGIYKPCKKPCPKDYY